MFPDHKPPGAAPVIGFLTRSIPRRILAALLSIYVATYFATAVVVYSGVRASILESDATALNQLAALKYEQLVNMVGALATDLTAWSELDVMNDLVSGDIDKRVTQTLEALKRLYGLTGDIYAFDATGQLLASSDGGRSSGRGERIPPQWQNTATGLAFIDRAADPMTGSEVVALEIPVFGSFDKTYRIGSLVMTVPWASIEKLLFASRTGRFSWKGASRHGFWRPTPRTSPTGRESTEFDRRMVARAPDLSSVARCREANSSRTGRW